MEAAVGVSVEVFKVLSLDRFCTVLWSRSPKTRTRKEIFKVFFQDKVRVQQRFVEQNCEAPRVSLESSLTWVWWRSSPA